MQIAVEEDTRIVRQWGDSLGALDGCVCEEVTPEVLAAIQAALPAHGGGIVLSVDHCSMTPTDPAPDVAARAALVAQRDAALAALQAHAHTNPDDPVSLLARALGVV